MGRHAEKGGVPVPTRPSLSQFRYRTKGIILHYSSQSSVSMPHVLFG